jgi:hypothetical protein
MGSVMEDIGTTMIHHLQLSSDIRREIVSIWERGRWEWFWFAMSKLRLPDVFPESLEIWPEIGTNERPSWGFKN